MVGEVEIGEKTQGAECERQDWRYDALEEPGCEKYSAISTQLIMIINEPTESIHI